MVSDRTHRSSHWFVGALLTIGTAVLGGQLTPAQTAQQSWLATLGWGAAGVIITFFFLRWQSLSGEESPEAINTQVDQLQADLRTQVQGRSYGARSKLIEAPLKELDLDITPRLGWVRDPRLVEPDLISEKTVDIVAAFESSKRRLLIVGEPGSGKTTAAYALIEHLDETEGDERVPLLVNLSAWEAQENFEAFLVDYLGSEVGYQVRKPAVARAFIRSRRYTLVLDGLDEIPAGLRKHFSERLDEFVRGMPREVAVVVTCRTLEYQALFAALTTGLGLVQAVEILPLTSQQLDSALVELAKFDKDWEIFLSQRHLEASQRARDLLSNPLFLNLAVAGRLRPRELLHCNEEQELRYLLLDRYLDSVLAERSEHEPKDARCYLTWISRFLNGAEVSPFGLKTSDATVFDLANLTPPDPPRQYRLFEALGLGLAFGLGGLLLGEDTGLLIWPLFGLFIGLFWLAVGLVEELLGGWPYRHSAASFRLTPVWASSRQQRRGFLGKAGRGLVRGLVFGLVWGLVLGLVWGLVFGVIFSEQRLYVGLVLGLLFGLVIGSVFGLVGGLFETRSVLITSRTPKEANSRSLIAALVWMLGGLAVALVWGLVLALDGRLVFGLVFGLVWGLAVGLIGGLRNGGWFVLLQKVALRHLVQAGNLPPYPYDFLEWGIERQIFRRVGGGVRFRHNLIQQHIANTSEGTLPYRARFEYKEEPLVSSSGLVQLGGLAAIVSGMLSTFVTLQLFLWDGSPGNSDFILVTEMLLILGLIGLYARRPNAVGIFGLTAFLIALLGELGLLGYDLSQLSPQIALESWHYSYLLACLGWLLLGVCFLRARLYSRLAAILLITSSLFQGLLVLTVLWNETYYWVIWNETYYGILFNVLLASLNQISIVWLGVALWTGRDLSSESPTQQQPQREQLHQPSID